MVIRTPNTPEKNNFQVVTHIFTVQPHLRKAQTLEFTNAGSADFPELPTWKLLSGPCTGPVLLHAFFWIPQR